MYLYYGLVGSIGQLLVMSCCTVKYLAVLYERLASGQEGCVCVCVCVCVCGRGGQYFNNIVILTSTIIDIINLFVISIYRGGDNIVIIVIIATTFLLG